MKQKLIEIVGWYGTVAIVLAYALTSFGLFTTNNVFYQLLNFTGALGIVIEALSKKDYQPGVLNIIWTIIAAIAIIRIIFNLYLG